ncbi:MAG: hypothetical protein IPM91_15180 [Bacteroidetes bacterium]|nr:hypothetical protein [Bacteroidota bacterium]
MGGEITWECVKSGPNIGRFIFTVKLYRDCNGVNGPNSINLETNAPGYAGGILCNLITQTDISPVGPGCPTCANPMGFANAVEEFVYKSAPIFITGYLLQPDGTTATRIVAEMPPLPIWLQDKVGSP